MTLRTQVGIVGAGPAGLTLAHLLRRAGIDSIVIEDRSRDYIERRIRAGVLEQGTRDLLLELGLGGRMEREGLIHHGIEIRFDGHGHRIPLSELSDGRVITIYGQQELVKDLVAARLEQDDPVLFEVSDVRLEAIDEERPRIAFRHDGRAEVIECDFIAGCDGSHGISHDAIPTGVLSQYERNYPFAWLGIMAEVAPSSDELIYCSHERGFALHSMRSPTLTRLYLQVDVDESLDTWPDERIWSELRARFATDDGFELADGPIIDRSITPLRGYVREPMQYARLFLAGDAAHIVPATGAKGLNLAVSDVNALADGLIDWYRGAGSGGLDGYTARCLWRVWRVQEFSWYMSSLLHNLPGDDAFGRRMQLAELDWLARSRDAAASLARNYTGLPFS